MYLPDEKLENKQIIPKKWIKQSLKKHVEIELKINDNLIITGLEYSWLSGKINNYNLFLATDLGGQFIIHIPDENITIVTTRINILITC